MDSDDQYYMFDDRWFHVICSSTYHTFDAILGHISVSIEIYGSSWSCMLIPTYKIHVDTMFPPWSLSGVTQLGLHFATPRCHHAFLLGDAPLIYGSDSVVHVDDLDRAFDDEWSELHLVLLTYHAFDAILGHTPIPRFVRSFADALTTRSTSWSSWVIIPGHSPFIAFPTGSYTHFFGFAMSYADFMIIRPTCRSLYVIT